MSFSLQITSHLMFRVKLFVLQSHSNATSMIFFLIYPQTSSDSLLCASLIYSLGIQNMTFISVWASLVAPAVKNLPANAGDTRDMVQPLGWEDPLEEGMATHSSIVAWRIPMDRGAWRVTVHRIAKHQIQLKRLSKHASSLCFNVYLLSLTPPHPLLRSLSVL